MPHGAEPQLTDVGEAGILEVIRRIAAAPDPAVVVGIGDDAAVVRTRADRDLVVTTDIQIEGVHFQRRYAAPYDVGWKAMAINLSDIAAMGALPRHALVSLAVPPDLPLRWVEDLYRGLSELGGSFGATIVGGNLARTSGPMTVDVTLVGEVEEDLLLRRTGAGVGDVVLVTGSLGRSAAGLAVATHGLQIAGREELLTSHLRPHPRVHEARVVSRSRMATAMIDLSDGLAMDLGRLCDANALGVRIDAALVPVDEAVHRAADLLGTDALELALFGGEDYELLIAVPPAHAQVLADRIRQEVGTAVTVIGEFVHPREGRSLVRDGTLRPLAPQGWDHFREGLRW